MLNRVRVYRTNTVCIDFIILLLVFHSPSGELISKNFQCKPLFYYFSCGPFASNRHANSMRPLCVCLCVFVFASSSAVYYLLSAKINCVTSSIFVFFVFNVVVVVCSLSGFPFYSCALTVSMDVFVFAVRLY